MKRLFRALLLALPFFSVASSAQAIGFDGGWPYKIEAGANAYFRVNRTHQAGQSLGPWYLYWPMEAHFWPQAPQAYGTWPQPMTLPPQFNPPMPTPMPQFRPPMPAPLPPFQPPRPTPLPDNGIRR
jgi:hypothetical protein